MEEVAESQGYREVFSQHNSVLEAMRFRTCVSYLNPDLSHEQRRVHAGADAGLQLIVEE